MSDLLISFLDFFDNFIWSYLGFPAIMVLGLILTIKSRFVQIVKFPVVVKTFLSFMKSSGETHGKGVHPLQAFFACIGGCVGVGNIVAICTAVQIGGPGALFWIWVTAIMGMIVKYAEVYLGVKFRVATKDGYSGGPQYFLQRVFKTMWVPNLVAVLLCIYGVEVYQFSVVAQSVSNNFSIDLPLIVGVLLFLVLFAGWGGVQRVGNISSWIIPLFVVIYVGMGLWVLLQNVYILGSVFANVFEYAFTPHGALGGFVGSTLLVTIAQGVKRGCYTGDVGIGYASVIHSETSVRSPEKQASLVIFEVFLDTFVICTTSVVLILTTGVWLVPMDAASLVQTALGQYFPYMNFFMPFFLFLLGYSTINAYFVVGLKCAEFLSPRFGKWVFNAYAILALIIFSFIDSTQAQAVMAVTGGLLLIINCYGIFKLRHEISFNLEEEKTPEMTLQPATDKSN